MTDQKRIEDFQIQALKTPKGTTLFFDIDIIPKQDHANHFWNGTVRGLEAQGLAVGVTTKNFPTGVYIADGLNLDGSLKGWGLESEIPEKLIITNIGWPFLSTIPTEPRTDGGLKMVSHHIMGASFCESGTWSDFYYLPCGRLSVSVADTSGIQYGQAGFEGCMVMRNQNEDIFAYRLNKNAARFNRTVQALDLPAFDAKKHEKAMEQVAKSNQAYIPKLGQGKLYIRPSVCGLNGGLGVIVPDTSVVTIEVAAFGDYLPETIKVEGRLDVHRPPTGFNKIAPNYGGTYKIKHGVKARGYHDYLSFDSRGMVEEVATCAAAFIDKNRTYVFPPVLGEIDEIERNILPSITRESLIEVLQTAGEKLEIRDVSFEEVKTMKGFFTLGNAVGVLCVEEICMKKTEADPGEIITFKETEYVKKINDLRDSIYASRTGKLEGFKHWAKKIV